MYARTLIAACLVMVLLAVVATAGAHTTTGKIQSIRVNDLSNSKGLDGDERNYAVAVRLESDQERLLGLSPAAEGQLSDSQKAMARLLHEAFLRNWTVTIRWDSPVRSHASILSVIVSRE